MGRYDITRRQPPTWQTTLGAMKAEGARVLRSCSCGFHGAVDLEHMIGVLGGPDMSLWDCRPPCPLCGAAMLHLASPGPGTPYRPLTSDPEDHDHDPLPPQAWMAGWTGRRRTARL